MPLKSIEALSAAVSGVIDYVCCLVFDIRAQGVLTRIGDLTENNGSPSESGFILSPMYLTEKAAGCRVKLEHASPDFLSPWAPLQF